MICTIISQALSLEETGKAEQDFSAFFNKLHMNLKFKNNFKFNEMVSLLKYEMQNSTVIELVE